MKKISLFLILFSFILLSGCTKESKKNDTHSTAATSVTSKIGSTRISKRANGSERMVINIRFSKELSTYYLNYFDELYPKLTKIASSESIYPGTQRLIDSMQQHDKSWVYFTSSLSNYTEVGGIYDKRMKFFNDDPISLSSEEISVNFSDEKATLYYELNGKVGEKLEDMTIQTIDGKLAYYIQRLISKIREENSGNKDKKALYKLY